MAIPLSPTFGSSFRADSAPGSPNPLGLGAWAIAELAHHAAQTPTTPAATVSLQGRIIVGFSRSILRKSISPAAQDKGREVRGGKPAGRGARLTRSLCRVSH